MKWNKTELKTKNKRNNSDYKIVNIILVIIFIIGLTYIVFSNESMSCYYKDNFNISCKTCGITRDFKSILKLDFSYLINSISINLFISIVIFFISRFVTLIMLSKDIKLRYIVTFDIIIVIITIANTL